MENLNITPEKIIRLQPKQIFVFGSNEAGVHGSGAAAAALKFGATLGVGWGKQGKTFAIPTKDWMIKTLELDVIEFYVQRFIAFTEYYQMYDYLVTPIGCGLAGYRAEDIAPLFDKVYQNPATYDNIHLPKSFWEIGLNTTL